MLRRYFNVLFILYIKVYHYVKLKKTLSLRLKISSNIVEQIGQEKESLQRKDSFVEAPHYAKPLK